MRHETEPTPGKCREPHKYSFTNPLLDQSPVPVAQKKPTLQSLCFLSRSIHTISIERIEGRQSQTTQIFRLELTVQTKQSDLETTETMNLQI